MGSVVKRLLTTVVLAAVSVFAVAGCQSEPNTSVEETMAANGFPAQCRELYEKWNEALAAEAKPYEYGDYGSSLYWNDLKRCAGDPSAVECANGRAYDEVRKEWAPSKSCAGYVEAAKEEEYAARDRDVQLYQEMCDEGIYEACSGPPVPYSSPSPSSGGRRIIVCGFGRRVGACF